MNTLCYGGNLKILREFIKNEKSALMPRVSRFTEIWKGLFEEVCMKIAWRFSLFIHVILFASVVVSFAQAPESQDTGAETKTTEAVIVKPRASPTPSPSPRTSLIKNVVRDQKAIWLSPFRLKAKDLKWLAPIAATTTALIFTDRETSSWVSRNGSLPKASRYVSFGGSIYTTGGVAAGFYLIGRATRNRRAQETGMLAVEALINTAIVTEILKLATQRMRPNTDSGRGRFFTHGNSFPSGHSSSAWAVATVIAYEYQDRPFVRYGAFAVAAAISLSRYSGRNHFLSDVLTGSAIGFGIGRFVYRSHHIKTPDAADKDPSGTFSWVPLIAPFYDRKSSTYGGRLTWNL